MADLKGVVVGEFGETRTITLRNSAGTAQDVSAYAGTKTIYFRSPDAKVTITSTAAFTNTGTDGQLDFAFTSDSTPDRDGEWDFQVWLEDTGQTRLAKSAFASMQVEHSID